MAGKHFFVRKHAMNIISVITIILLVAILASCEMEREPNEPLANANIIPSTWKISGNITYDTIETDQDYYTILLPAGTYVFSLENLTADLQLMLYIYDDSWNFVSVLPRSDNPGLTNETITFTGGNVFNAVLLVQGSGDRPPTVTGQYVLRIR